MCFIRSHEVPEAVLSSGRCIVGYQGFKSAAFSLVISFETGSELDPFLLITSLE